jgi:hypothetical protein
MKKIIVSFLLAAAAISFTGCAKYAPSGVYIMRIHGTFVNFLDLSPAIQEDIIRRLDPGSTSLAC